MRRHAWARPRQAACRSQLAIRSYITAGDRPSIAAAQGPYAGGLRNPSEFTMGKYVLGWFLGVPLVVLVAIYFFAH
ncbi:MAG: hypothetical protein ACXWCV_02870 [Caldimonas sp.]